MTCCPARIRCTRTDAPHSLCATVAAREEVVQPSWLHHLLDREADQTACPRKRRSRRLLPTTKTELNAIAAPAIIGSSRPNAAIGIAAVL